MKAVKAEVHRNILAFRHTSFLLQKALRKYYTRILSLNKELKEVRQLLILTECLGSKFQVMKFSMLITGNFKQEL